MERSEHQGGCPAVAGAPEFCTCEDEREPFEYEGFFTHYVCPECGFNDYAEGDLRGDEVECDGCGYKARVAG